MVRFQIHLACSRASEWLTFIPGLGKKQQEGKAFMTILAYSQDFGQLLRKLDSEKAYLARSALRLDCAAMAADNLLRDVKA